MPASSKETYSPKVSLVLFSDKLLLEPRNYFEFLITGGGIVCIALHQNSYREKKAKYQNPEETFITRSGLLAWTP
jgi:hypothetical protein